MSGTYKVEAVRDLQAMYPHDVVVKQGELLSLILDNGKLCLVHRKDDLPFVVPKPYIVHKELEECRRTGSFSHFLNKRKCSRARRNYKYPMSSYNLESVCPQFASVAWSSSATCPNEISLEKDTAVLILDADPQSLLWYGVTQHGKYGMMSRDHVSVITQPNTPSLQMGCNLTTHTRMAHVAEGPDELSVEKGSYLEVIGMPELWRWHVRLPRGGGDRTVGLLPIHVFNEVSVICSPEADINQNFCLSREQTPRVPSQLYPDDTCLMQAAARHATLRRRKDPLPARPTSSSSHGLNDLNRPPLNCPPVYVNNFNSFREFPDQEKPLPLCSNEYDYPQTLQGISANLVDDSEETYAAVDTPVRRADDAFNQMLSLVEVIRKDRESLKKSKMDLEAHVGSQFKRFERAAAEINQLVQDERNFSQQLVHHSNAGYQGEFEEEEEERAIPQDVDRDGTAVNYANTFPKERDFKTFSRKETHTIARRSSLTDGAPLEGIYGYEGGGAIPKRILEKSESQPMLDRCGSEDPLAMDQGHPAPLFGGYFQYTPLLDSGDIDVIVTCICPPEKRPLVHWKPLLVKLGLRLGSAEEIMKMKLNSKDEWRHALYAWRKEKGQYVTMYNFLEELKRTQRFDVYSAIVKSSSTRMKQKLYCSVETFV